MSIKDALQPDVRPREVFAWAMYDFANSGYTTVVITAVFNAYFVGVVCAGESWGTFAWTLALSLSYALIIFTAPILGAYADAHAVKKRILVITTSGCVLGTALFEAGRPQEAEKSLRSAIALKPSFAEAHCTLGFVMRRLHRPSEPALRPSAHYLQRFLDRERLGDGVAQFI